jgi:maltose O-acetyltransferase
MKQIKEKIINKLERLFEQRLVPRLIQWGEYSYSHQD